MPTITRTWLAFAAVGTGLIHLALVLGAPVGAGVVLAVLGLVEFGWGVLTFARETLIVPRVALIVAIAPIVAWAALSVTGLAGFLGLLPLAVTTLFELFAAAVLGRHLRRGMSEVPPFPNIARYLVALGAGALIVAGLTAPALAATEVAEHTSGDLLDLDPHGH